MLTLGRGGLDGARDLRRQLRDDQRHEARRVQRAGAGGGGGRAHAAQGALAQPCGGEGSGVRLCLCIYYYLPSTLLLSTPKPSCPDDKEDVESNLFPEAEDSEEKLCWLETEAVETVDAPTAAWTAWATCGWMASRICCTRLPLAREAWAWEEKEESREAARDEEELEEELEEEEEEELEEEEETDNSLVAFST